MIEESQNDELQMKREFESWEAASDEDWLKLEPEIARGGVDFTPAAIHPAAAASRHAPSSIR